MEVKLAQELSGKTVFFGDFQEYEGSGGVKHQ